MTLSYFHFFELAAVLAGIVLFRSVKHSSMLWLWLLSVVGFGVDLASRWAIDAGLPNNYFIFNLYPVLAAPLIYYGFYKHLDLATANKRIYKVAATSISLLFVLNYGVITGPNKIAVIAIVFFYFFNVLLCCGLLFKLAMRDEIFRFSDQPVFWAASGLLIFSLGALVTLGMHQFIRVNQLTIHNKALYRVIMPALNVVLYSSFTYAFILCKLKKKSFLRLSS